MPVESRSYDPAVRERVFDYLRPPSDTPLPLLMFLHGGGWISGDPSMYAEEVEWFSQQGFACASVAYRLAPLHNFPTPVSDVLAFVAYARKNAAELGIDPDRIVAMGNSAGGHLACMAGLCTTDPATNEPCQPVAGVVAVCPITDVRDPATTHFPIAMSFLEQFLGCSSQECPEKWDLASPVRHVTPTGARFLLIHGTEDEIVPNRQSHLLAETLAANGVPHEVVDLPGEYHGFSLPAWDTIRQRAAAFAGAL